MDRRSLNKELNKLVHNNEYPLPKDQLNKKFNTFKKIWMGYIPGSKMRKLLETDVLYEDENEGNMFMGMDTCGFMSAQFLISLLYLLYINIGSLLFGIKSVFFIDVWMIRALCLTDKTLIIVQFLLILNLNFTVLMTGYGRSTWQREPMYFGFMRSAALFVLFVYNFIITLVDKFFAGLTIHYHMNLANTDPFSVYMAYIGLFKTKGLVNPAQYASVQIAVILFCEMAFCSILAWYYFNEAGMTFEYFKCLVALNDPWIFANLEPEKIEYPDRPRRRNII